MPGRNGGTLRAGNPGCRGGTGRTPSALREALRDLGAQNLDVLADMARGVVRTELRETCPQCGHEPQGAAKPEDLVASVPAPADRRGAIDTMFKYGLGTQKEVIDVDRLRDKLRAVRSIVRRRLPTEQAEPLLAEIRAAMEA
jgi:hypothetical protein